MVTQSSRRVCSLLNRMTIKRPHLCRLNVLLVLLITFCGTVGCVTAPLVLELALADAALRNAKANGVELKYPDVYNETLSLLEQSRFHYKKRDYGEAKLYAVQARQLIEQAELRVMEELGSSGLETETTSIPSGEEDEFFGL